MRPYLQIDFPDGTQTWFPILAERERSGLLAVSPIRRAVAWEGRTAAPEVSVLIYDADRFLRTYIASRTRDIVGKPCRVVSDYIRFEGIVTAWTPKRGLTFEIKATDVLSFHLQKQVPIAKVDATTYPNAPAESVGKPLLYPYGILDSAVAVASHGAYGTFCVDATNNDYFVSALAIETVLRVWRNENGVWRQVPAADYTVLTNAAGHVVVRVTPYTGGPGAGKEHIRLDVKGIASAGVAITNPVDIVKHYLVNLVGVPESALNADSWNAARTRAADKGYKAAGVVGMMGAQDASQVLADMLATFLLEVMPLQDGTIGARIYEPTADPDVELAVPRDVVDFHIETDFRELANILNVQYAPIWGEAGYYLHMEKTDSVSRSIYGDRQRTLNLNWTYDSTTALEIARIMLGRLKFPQQRLTVRAGRVVEVGQKVLIQHEDQISERSVYAVREAQVDPITGECEIVAVNVEALAPRNIFILGDKTALPAFWTSADANQRRYGYLCDSQTGLFSDGSPGKVL
jgi:hypothetical protein